MQILIYHPGEVETEDLLSKEGTNQVCPLSMAIYGIRLYVLVEQIREEYPIFLKSCYADDFRMAGAVAHLKHYIYCIKALGPTHSFFLETEKSQFLRVLAVLEEAERVATAPLECIHGEGARQIGFLLGIMSPNSMDGREGGNLGSRGEAPVKI